jgi:hypothetical protein
MATNVETEDAQSTRSCSPLAKRERVLFRRRPIGEGDLLIASIALAL